LYQINDLVTVHIKAKALSQVHSVLTKADTQVHRAPQEHKDLQAQVADREVEVAKVATATVATVDENRLQTPRSPTE
jgi:arginine deiminase